jgi:hypothetical protein
VFLVPFPSIKFCITRMLRRFVIFFPVFLFIMGEGKDIWMSSVFGWGFLTVGIG